MKKRIPIRVLSTFLAVVMTFLMVPLSVINVEATTTIPPDLPSSFKITAMDGEVTYNIPAANMTYDFYIAARSYIDNYATNLAELQGDEFSFATNDATYYLSSVYAYKPSRSTWNNTCGALTGIFNYKVVENGVEKTKHVALVAFRGTDGADDIMTDLDFQDEEGYHNGFFKTARNHYNHMIENVSYDLGNGSSISFYDFLKKMREPNSDYTMIVTGHSLGGAVANIFTAYWLRNFGMVKNTNVVAYTYGSPCTCSKETAEATKIDNVFNFINAYDWVPKVGYGGINLSIYINPAVEDSGCRQGIDFVYAKGTPKRTSRVPLSLTNHKMSIYSEIKRDVNAYIESLYPDSPPTVDDLISIPKFEYSATEKGIAKILEFYTPMFDASETATKSLLGGDSIHTVVVKTITSFLGIEIESETDKALERMEIEIRAINNKLDGIDEKVSEIQESIDEIGNSIEAAKNEIIGAIIDTDTRNKLDDFTIAYKVKLDSVDEQHSFLIEKLEELDKKKATSDSTEESIAEIEENVKVAYDQLYDAASDLSNYLYQHMTVHSVNGGTETMPVQDILYDQYNTISGKDPTANCEAFVTDLYTGYVFAEYCLWLCNTQRMAWLDTNEKTTYKSNSTGKYIGIEGVKDEWSINDEEHLAVLESLTSFEAKLNNEKFKSAILHVISETGTMQQLPLNQVEICVGGGDILYMRDIAAELQVTSLETQLNWFDDMAKFFYEVSDPSLATITNDGMMTIDEAATNDSIFAVTLKYQSNPEAEKVVLHTWTFRIGKSFPWCGIGTKYAPFIISSLNDLKAFFDVDNIQYTANEANYFVLLKDIDLRGETLTALSRFKGVFDGRGHSIYGFELSTSSMTVGLINHNYGTIKNLTIGSDSGKYFTIANQGQKSVVVYREVDENSGHTYFGGALVGCNENDGIIENCNVTNVYVGCNMRDVDDNCTLYCIVGGLVGCNNGTIDECSVENSCIAVYTPTVTNSGDDNHSYAGGFIGKLNGGSIKNSLATKNFISAVAEGNGYDAKPNGSFADPWGGTTKNNYAYPCSIACGFVAEMTTGAIEDSFVHGNDLKSSTIAENGDKYTDGRRMWDGTFYYLNSSATLTNCTDDIAVFKENLSNINDNWIVEGDVPSLNGYVDASVSLTTTEYCIDELFDPSTIWTDLLDKRGKITEEGYPYFSYEMEPIGEIGTYMLKVFIYGDIVKETTINIVEHDWDDGKVTMPATHITNGIRTYTCGGCGATKTEEFPPVDGHAYGSWSKRNETQHVRSCECGKTEYADHNWDDGTITTPATYEKEGVRTYECLDCEATYTVVIPIPVSIHLFVVDDASAVPGGTMRVNVRLENNPGIAMMRLKISYDSSVLDLEQVNYNTEIGGTATQPTISDGYVTLLWYNDSENVEGDWIFATLTFTVRETATVGSVSDIVLTYDADEVCDIEENNVVFSIDNGIATVLDHVPGDINGDDGLTSKDLLRLARYFAGWDVEVNENALDINGDGNVSSKDLLRLARYLAGWDVKIH